MIIRWNKIHKGQSWSELALSSNKNPKHIIDKSLHFGSIAISTSFTSTLSQARKPDLGLTRSPFPSESLDLRAGFGRCLMTFWSLRACCWATTIWPMSSKTTHFGRSKKSIGLSLYQLSRGKKWTVLQPGGRSSNGVVAKNTISRSDLGDKREQPDGLHFQISIYIY